MLHFGRDSSGFCEGYDATLGTTTDGAADVGLSSSLCTTRKNESQTLGQLVGDVVDGLFQLLDGTLGQMG